MTPGTGERRADIKSLLLERLQDPLQLRLIVIGTTLLLGYMAIYTPLAARITATERQLDKEHKLAGLAKNLEQLNAQCRRFAKRIPNQADSKEWMQYIHEGVRGFPLTLSKLDCLPTKKIGPYQVVVMKLDLSGTYYELNKFLRWLETNPRLLRVDEITFRVAEEKNKSKKTEANKDDMVMQIVVLGLAG